MQLLPAITQTSAHPKMSNRYVHVNTKDIIDVMESEGFVVSGQKVNKSRSGSTFGRHMVMFQNPNIVTSDPSFVPQMLLLNSHDGTTPAVFRLGVYRFVCENGMVVGNDYATEKIRHVGDLARQVIERARTLSAQSTKVFSQIDSWMGIDMSAEKRLAFAETAAKLRFGEALSKQYNAGDLLVPRRGEDDAGDLWSTFNIVQENTTKGGLVGRNANNRRVSSRPLVAIGQDFNFNSQLWELAAEYAE